MNVKHNYRDAEIFVECGSGIRYIYFSLKEKVIRRLYSFPELHKNKTKVSPSGGNCDLNEKIGF